MSTQNYSSEVLREISWAEYWLNLLWENAQENMETWKYGNSSWPEGEGVCEAFYLASIRVSLDKIKKLIDEEVK